MKKTTRKNIVWFRRALATTFACSIVLGVPVLSAYQYRFLVHHDGRNADPLAAMQTRAVDADTKPYQLFNEPLISVTFDDGWESTYEDAMPLLQKYGIRSTQYVLSGVEDNPQYLSWNQIKQIKAAGHEIGCHTDTHPDLRLLDNDDVMSQLSMCKTKLEQKNLGPINSFASPYGSFDDRTLGQIKKVFASQRDTDGDSSNGVTEVDVNMSKNFNQYDIVGMTVKHDTKAEEIQALVDFAVKNNAWVVLTFHQAGDGSTKFGIDSKGLESQLQVLNRSKARIVTVNQAMESYKK